MPSIAPTDATQGPVNVTFTNNSTKEGLTLKYQINSQDENGWLEYTEKVPMTANGSVYAKLFDSANQSKGIAEAIVDNIDTQKPEKTLELKVEATTNSITVKGTATDRANDGARPGIAGIKEYQFILMDGEGTPLTEWIPLEELPAEGEKQNTHLQLHMEYNKEKHIE